MPRERNDAATAAANASFKYHFECSDLVNNLCCYARSQDGNTALLEFTEGHEAATPSVFLYDEEALSFLEKAAAYVGGVAWLSETYVLTHAFGRLYSYALH